MSTNRDQYLADLWTNLLEYITTNRILEPEMISHFYEPCSLYELTDEKAIILAPNIVSKQIVKSQAEIISNALIDLLSLDHSLIVEIYQKTELPARYDLTRPIPLYDESDFQSMPIQKDRTFENFVVGDCNRESQAAALACAMNPGKFFNPLFIFGNSGLGKTHLLMAIANYVLKADPNKKVYYTESLKFVETVVNAIRDNKIDAFKQYMYNIDLLLVDDIQFLAGKEKSHEIGTKGAERRKRDRPPEHRKEHTADLPRENLNIVGKSHEREIIHMEHVVVREGNVDRIDDRYHRDDEYRDQGRGQIPICFPVVPLFHYPRSLLS